ncbi:MAG: SusC/RagA family TonB-linked outer membrane protein, partial [Bacteroidetes bacterium]|nr:SusC/RagA family TonB-linked outer membrane protein [Bacteroidota bacterium]
SHPYSSRPDLTTSYNGPTYANQDTYITRALYNNEPSVSLSPTMANSSLKPYSVTSYEGGLETNFFDNRIGLDLTYFYTLNGPQIFSKTAPASTGYNYQLINGVVTKKDGYELTLRFVPIFNKTGMRWQISMNGSTYRETLHEAIGKEDGISLNGHYYKIGERMDGIFGTKYNRDNEGNVIFDAGGMPVYSPKGDEHNKLLGYANPDYVWGISSNFSYKNISFNLQFDGRVGGTIFNELYARQFQSGNSPTLVSGSYGEARRKEWDSYKNTGSIDPGLVGNGVKIVSGTPKFENGYITNMDEDLTFAPNDKAVRLQSYTQSIYSNIMEEFMVDKTYTKLREVSVGYSFQTKLFQGKPQQITVSLVGRNLLYFSKVDNMDMDQWAEGYNASETRIDSRPSIRLQSPTTRQIGFNLNVNF